MDWAPRGRLTSYCTHISIPVFGRLLLQSALSSLVNDCLATLGHSISYNHPRFTKL